MPLAVLHLIPAVILQSLFIGALVMLCVAPGYRLYKGYGDPVLQIFVYVFLALILAGFGIIAIAENLNDPPDLLGNIAGIFATTFYLFLLLTALIYLIAAASARFRPIIFDLPLFICVAAVTLNWIYIGSY